MADIHEDPEPELPRPVRTRKGVILVGARAVVGLIGIGTAVVTVAAATWLPLPTVGDGPTSTLVTPVAAAQQRICPGPVLRLGDETGQDATTAISVGRSEVVRASTRGVPALEDMQATQNTTNVPSQRLTLAPATEGEDSGILAGSQSQYVEAVDFVGFAAAQCAKPSSERWLVGGATVTGRTTLISLNNPSKVSSTVNLSIYSETGLVSAAGSDGIVVPPGGQRILSLAGFAPGIASPVVRVLSTGGQVVANLQESIVRTLDPGGVDLLGATTRPGTLTVIPGITLTDHDTVEAVQGAAGYQDINAILRIFIPGTGPAEARITAVAEDGSSPASTSTLTIDAGVVSDFPLGDFADGSYTISVATDLPAVVAARASTVTLVDGPPADLTEGTEPKIDLTDFAWFVGAPELRQQALVSVAPGPSPVLHLVNTGTADAVVTIDAATGTANTVTVLAGAALAVPVVGGISYSLAGFETLRASVSYQDAGKLASFVLSPPEHGSQPVMVYW